MKPLVIFGAAELAEVARFYFTRDAGASVEAFTVDAQYRQQNAFCGLPVVAFEELAATYPPQSHDLFVALSYSNLNATRAERCRQARVMGYALRSYVSSKATVWPDLKVGDNCLILEDNTIQPFATIGDNTTLWCGNHIGHHVRIEDNCFITSHVVISGGVVIGEGSFVGVNATIRDHVRIGRRAVIGAGALITKDVPDEGVMSQAPAELSRVPSSRLRRL